MLEIKITAPEISEAINNLANAIIKSALHTGCHQQGENNAQIENAGVLNIDMSEPTINEIQPPTITENPTAPTSVPQSAPTVRNADNVSCPTSNTAPVPVVPTAAPQYTLEMIAKAGTALIDAGKMNELSALLARYHVEALTALDPSQYGSFATELRAMGANI